MVHRILFSRPRYVVNPRTRMMMNTISIGTDITDYFVSLSVLLKIDSQSVILSEWTPMSEAICMACL